MFKGPFLSILTFSAPTAVSECRRHDHPYVTLSRIIRIIALLLAVFLIVCLVALMTGATGADFFTLSRKFLSAPSGTATGLNKSEKAILLSIRLPRILLAGIVGCLVSGLLIFRLGDYPDWEQPKAPPEAG